MPTKTCTLCNTEKDFSEFLQDKSAKDGCRNQCKECLRERHNKAYEKRKVSHLQSLRKFRETLKGATHTSFKAAKDRCRKSGVPFDITLEYVRDLMDKQGGKCAITGEDLIPKGGRKAPSLDRMTPELGYVVGNVQWLSWKTNVIKQDMNMDEFYDFCKKVIDLRC